MKYSDKFFRFPVKLYLTKDLEEKSDLETRLGIEFKKDEKPEPDYVTGWECIDVDDICGFGTIFSRTMTIEDVKERGFDCTIVYLKYGKEVASSWDPKKFEEKLNKFYEGLEEYKRKDLEGRIREALNNVLGEREDVVKPKHSRWTWIKFWK